MFKELILEDASIVNKGTFGNEEQVLKHCVLLWFQCCGMFLVCLVQWRKLLSEDLGDGVEEGGRDGGEEEVGEHVDHGGGD